MDQDERTLIKPELKEKRGSILLSQPFQQDSSQIALTKQQQLFLKWDNVTYAVQVTENKQKINKKILDNVSGTAMPGQVLAIMGPSGGGKTSLLNLLAGRVKQNEGTVHLNGGKLPKNFNRISAYVMQDDLLFATLTPREIITLAANLRLTDLTPENRLERINYIIKILGLTSCADTRVGQPLQRGISGGERKRTAIAYEMVTNPSLIFLDEPTTGLDSFTALSMIRSLQQLALLGRTVICTIHQPSSEIFALFDKLILLAKGKLVYEGQAAAAVRYFSGIGFPCPTYSNPSDYYMKILSTRDDDDIKRVAIISGAWKGVTDPVDTTGFSEVAKPTKQTHASFFTEIKLLTWRAVIDAYRNPVNFFARFLQFIILGIFLGALYVPLSNDQTSIQNRAGALYFIAASMVMTSINSVILTFPLERALLIRDQYSGMYRVWTYFLGKMLADFFFLIPISIVASLIPYWFIGLSNTAHQFFTFLLIVWCLMFLGGSIGLLLGCVLSNPSLAVAIAPVFIVPFLLFGGFFVNTSSIGPWLNWVQYIAPFKWGFEALGLNEFTGLVLICTPSEYIDVQGQQVCPVTTGEQVLANFSFTSSVVWEPIGIMLGISVMFRFIALIALQIQTRQALKRN